MSLCHANYEQLPFRDGLFLRPVVTGAHVERVLLYAPVLTHSSDIYSELLQESVGKEKERRAKRGKVERNMFLTRILFSFKLGTFLAKLLDLTSIHQRQVSPAWGGGAPW